MKMAEDRSNAGNNSKKIVLLAASFCLLLMATMPVFGQTEPPATSTPRATTTSTETKSDANTEATPKPPQAPPKPSQIKIGSVVFSGAFRLRVEDWKWFETTAADRDYTFVGAQLRLGLGQQREKFDWQVDGLIPFLGGLPEDAIALPPQGALGLGPTYFAPNGRKNSTVVLKQAYVRFKGLFGDKSSKLQLGRFEFSEGLEVIPKDATLATLKRDHISQRLVGPFGFTHIGRAFDGLQYVRDTKNVNFTFVGARVTEGAFQLNGNREMDVDIFYGALTKPLPGSEFRLFALHYHDGRGSLLADNRSLPARIADNDNLRITTVGGHFIGAHKGKRGTADLLIWGVGQFGDWGKLEHRAGAVAVEAGYQFKVKTNPWIRAGYFRGSGDGDPNDNRHNTFFEVLPTVRIYARQPFYNQMNNEDIFVQLRIKPIQRLALRGDVRYLRLSNRNDLWYTGGGAFQEQTFGYVGRPSGGKKGLGTFFDLSADITLTPTSSVTLYFSAVRGGSVHRFIYPQGGNHPISRFFYYEFNKRF